MKPITAVGRYIDGTDRSVVLGGSMGDGTPWELRLTRLETLELVSALRKELDDWPDITTDDQLNELAADLRSGAIDRIHYIKGVRSVLHCSLRTAVEMSTDIKPFVDTPD